MAEYVLKMVKSTMGGSEEVYTLTKEGVQTKQQKTLPNLDMDKFWADMDPTLQAIVAVCIQLFYREIEILE
jgi:hypothetical protein